MLAEDRVNCVCKCISPIALKKAKPLYNFGLSECNRVRKLIGLQCKLNRKYKSSKKNKHWKFNFVLVALNIFLLINCVLF